MILAMDFITFLIPSPITYQSDILFKFPSGYISSSIEKTYDKVP